MTTRTLMVAMNQIGHMLGRRYPLLEKELANLSEAAQWELLRLVQDVQQHVTQESKRAARNPFRRF